MTATFNLGTIALLMTLTAGGYTVATVGMKMASSGGHSGALALIAAGLAAAVFAETALLRQADLAVIYLGIVAFETLLVLIYAASISGMPTLPQLVGAGMVLGGFALVTVQP